MMNIMKKIFSFILAMLMMFTTCTSVFADEVKLDIFNENTVNGYKYTFTVNYNLDDQKWTGQSITPKPTITVSVENTSTTGTEEETTPIVSDGYTLVEDTDYTVTFTNNTKVGTATATITGIGNYQGSKSYNFKITGSATPSYTTVTPTSAKVKFSASNGLASKYKLVVKDSSGNVKFTQDNAVSGTAYSTGDVLTKGAQYYIVVYGYDEGTKQYIQLGSTSFKAKTTTSITASSIKTTSFKVKFNSISNEGITKYVLKVTNSSGKQVYYNGNAKGGTTYTISKLSQNTKYTVTVRAYTSDANYEVASKNVTTLPTVGTVKITVKAGNEMAKVSWKKISGAKGYEIYRATSKSGKYTKIKTVSASTTSYTNYLLTKNKTYYYKVRAYKVASSKNVYGKYSSIKSAKIKASTRYTYKLRANIKTNCTTVYAKGFDNKWHAVKAFATSAGVSGQSKPILGTHYTLNKYRWKYMHENCYTQYATRITGHYLFHSVPYSKQNPATLWTNSYNKLGSFASAGCIRMNVISVKWIYDHCPLKTRVDVVYSSKDDLKKPTVKKISSSVKGIKRKWDPTDPLSNNPWKK